MEMFFELSMAAMLTVIASILFYLLEKKTKFKNLPYMLKQTITGIFFGGIAVIGTEFGVDVGGATANARDSAPLCAGLIFGGPAGIISALIGGIERWFAVFWGAGEYSKVACSLSTILAGVYAALLRKYMFDDKKPSWSIGFAIAVVMEALHLTILFLTHLNDSENAFNIVKIVTQPMILVNAFAVSLSLFAIALLGKEKLKKHSYSKSISGIIQGRMLACVIVAFFATTIFVYAIQTGVSKSKAKEELALGISDIENQIESDSNANILRITRQIAAEYKNNNDINLTELAKKYSVEEINISNNDGILIKSTNPEFVGFDMKSGEQSQAFMDNLFEKREYAQSFGPITYDNSIYRKYAGMLIANGFVQIGYDAEHFQNDLYSSIKGITKYRHIGNTGYIVLVDRNEKIISDPNDLTGMNFKETRYYKPIMDSTEENEVFETVTRGIKTIATFKKMEGYTAFVFIPKEDVFYDRDAIQYINSYMEILVFAALFALIYLLIKKHVVTGIRSVNSSLAKITSGNLNVEVDVRSSDEFANLSDDINSTVDTLKHYIKDAEERINKELEFAKQIQTSSIPRVFPPFPNEKRFDVFASMRTAKEVGGDFYDFFFVGENKLAFLIADVSGKGIPAAMFMMTAKSIIKSYAETGISANEVLIKANNELCKNNDAGMFVTVWLGIIDLLTGVVTFSNAGHNPPALIRQGNNAEYLQSNSGLVLAGMEGIPYKICECKLEKNDKLFLYTDGITEATNAKEELFGEDRLLRTLKNTASYDVKTLCENVLKDADIFVSDAEQFDDMTMLCIQYNGE